MRLGLSHCFIGMPFPWIILYFLCLVDSENTRAPGPQPSQRRYAVSCVGLSIQLAHSENASCFSGLSLSSIGMPFPYLLFLVMSKFGEYRYAWPSALRFRYAVPVHFLMPFCFFLLSIPVSFSCYVVPSFLCLFFLFLGHSPRLLMLSCSRSISITNSILFMWFSGRSDASGAPPQVNFLLVHFPGFVFYFPYFAFYFALLNLVSTVVFRPRPV